MISKSELNEMRDREYRHGLVDAQMEIDLPLEIKALRRQRGWNQPEFAQRTGMKQPRISAMEKPGGANFTLETLKRLAKAFDVALIVRFAPFSELLGWSDRFSPDDFRVASFADELPLLEKQLGKSDATTRAQDLFRKKAEAIWKTIRDSNAQPFSDEFLDSITAQEKPIPSWIIREQNKIFEEFAQRSLGETPSALRDNADIPTPAQLGAGTARPKQIEIGVNRSVIEIRAHRTVSHISTQRHRRSRANRRKAESKSMGNLAHAE